MGSLAATTKRAVSGTARFVKSRTIESLRPSLGRKALAAFGTTTCKNLLAASGQHALAEAVAALADKAARLIRALHGSLRPNTLRLNPTRDRVRILFYFRGLETTAAPSLKPGQKANFSGIRCLIIWASGQVNAADCRRLLVFSGAH